MKAIEVQLAVHRAPETSRMQHEQLQRPLIDQERLAGQASAEIDRARHRSAPAAEASDAHIRKEGDGGGRQQEQQPGGERGRTEHVVEVRPSSAPHPFKGKHLDLSL
ncbi:hypothetical protein [Saccharibacillus alkalitolerans]|uniref:Uncharacterized protein n=1 Tax=Saccharibacillus alkalitolerans TaxID=2705290 RepID=A0ABX0F530_9BACL|nr:hypothetical protein [Saccharibacillus alkalitolerans]NGZ75478.1 hypothetical protein [Saccharibacillus alkalitolerans]